MWPSDRPSDHPSDRPSDRRAVLCVRSVRGAKMPTAKILESCLLPFVHQVRDIGQRVWFSLPVPKTNFTIPETVPLSVPETIYSGTQERKFLVYW